MQGHCGGRVTTGWNDPQRRGLELQERLDVEILSSVVLQRLVDDIDKLVLREVRQLAGVRNGVTRFIHSQLMLKDREASLGHRLGFVEATALSAHIAVNQ